MVLFTMTSAVERRPLRTVAGYDEQTGMMGVFVDSDSAIARGWAERVLETYRNHSDPISDRTEP